MKKDVKGIPGRCQTDEQRKARNTVKSKAGSRGREAGELLKCLSRRINTIFLLFFDFRMDGFKGREWIEIEIVGRLIRKLQL